jgi:pSer/pThr/pTyr-binding forkhead associated (FHA) protein
MPWFLILLGLALFLLVWTRRRRTGPETLSTAQLLLTSGAEVIQAFPVDSQVVVIGRDQPEGIEVFKDSISRSHAQIANEGGFFWVSDLNSTNGTFVNGRRIERQVLRDGDRIGVGGEILVFQGTREDRR